VANKVDANLKKGERVAGDGTGRGGRFKRLDTMYEYTSNPDRPVLALIDETFRRSKVTRPAIRDQKGFLGERSPRRGVVNPQEEWHSLVSLANDASATVESYHSVGNPLETGFGHGSGWLRVTRWRSLVTEFFFLLRNFLSFACDVDMSTIPRPDTMDL
jgi:hypothetical protein